MEVQLETLYPTGPDAARPRARRRTGLVVVGGVLTVLVASLGVAAAATFVTGWGTRGDGHGEFFSPRGVAVDAHGHVYVADEQNNRIQKFSGDGEFRRTWGSNGTKHGEFRYVNGVAVD